MSVIFILISISVLIAVGFLIAFIWAVKSGQYEDTISPSVRILSEDRKPETENEEKKESTKDGEQDWIRTPRTKKLSG